MLNRIFVLFSLFCLLGMQYATAQSTAITYKGYITDMYGKPLSGTYDLTFSLYNATSSDMLVWNEKHPEVAIKNGLTQVSLGKFKSGIRGFFTSTDEMYFKIKVSGMDFEHKIILPERARTEALTTGIYAQGLAGKVGTPNTPATPKAVTNATATRTTTVASSGGKWICPDIQTGKSAKNEYVNISVANTGKIAVKVWLTFYSATGKEVRSVPVDIPAMGSTTRKFRDADIPPDAAWAELSTNGASLYPSGFRKQKDEHPDGSVAYLVVPLEWYR